MRYSIWTDGSYSAPRKVSSSEFIILSDTMFIDSQGVRMEGLTSSSKAEAKAIALALDRMKDIVKPGDIIHIHTDSLFCRNKINSIVSNKYNGNSGVNSISSIKKTIDKFRKDDIKVSVFKVKGHKAYSITPNRLVDLLAKRRMRE